MRGAKAKELCYPNLDEAEEALHRLQEEMPGSRWLVIEYVDNSSI